MNWTAYVLVGWIILANGIALAEHGKQKTGEYNYFSTLVSSAIIITLYYFAGLFN